MINGLMQAITQLIYYNYYDHAKLDDHCGRTFLSTILAHANIMAMLLDSLLIGK
jgi:hypothetical protein